MVDRSQADLSLVLAVVQQQDAADLTGELETRGHQATRLDVHGGFLQLGSAVVLVGTEVAREAGVVDAVARTCCRRVVRAPGGPVGDPVSGVDWPTEVVVGGAVVFSLPVERRVQLRGRRAGLALGAASGRR